MRRISSQTDGEKQALVAGILLCLSTTFFLLFAGIGGVGLGLASGLRPAQVSKAYIHIYGSDTSVSVIDVNSGILVKRYYLNYRIEPSDQSKRSDPVKLVDGVLYYAGYRGIYAAKQEDGALLWKQQISTSSFGDVQQLDVVDDTVYARVNSSLYALRASDGSIRWQHQVSADIPGEIRGIYAVVTNSSIYCDVYTNANTQHSGAGSSTDQWTYVLNARDGSFRWKQAGVIETPVIEHEVIYSYNYATLQARSLKDGTLLWQRKGVEPISSLNVYNDNIYVVDTKNIFALRARDQSFLWYAPHLETESNIQVFDGIVYTNSQALSADDGHVLWSHNGLILLKNETLYGISTYGAQYLLFNAYDIRAGTLLWQQPMNVLNAGEVMVMDGILFSLQSDGFVYAIMASTGQFLWQIRVADSTSLSSQYSSSTILESP